MGNQKKRRNKGKSVVVDDFTPETIRKKRTLPKKDIVFMCILVALQILCVVLIALYRPTPKDTIRQYTVTVEPCANGTLDIHYDITWTALDGEEPLTWVEIGMPNPDHYLIESSVSDTVSHAEFDDFFCTQRFDFKDSYIGGETVRFSFTINAGSMLTLSDGGYFYEFVPGWFNAIPVESYTFKWKLSDHVLSHNASAIEDGYAVWQGSLDCGGYVSMQVAYDESAFDPMTPPAVYTPFDGSDAYNSLTSDRIALGILFGAIALLLVIPQVFIVDCFVSYHRGRGFLRGYGHHHHVYGHNNPHYEKAAIVHGASGGGHYYRGGRSGGGFACACACACACAGGGRAGCSQKNTTALSEGEEKRTALPILRYKK